MFAPPVYIKTNIKKKSTPLQFIINKHFIDTYIHEKTLNKINLEVTSAIQGVLRKVQATYDELLNTHTENSRSLQIINTTLTSLIHVIKHKKINYNIHNSLYHFFLKHLEEIIQKNKNEKKVSCSSQLLNLSDEIHSILAALLTRSPLTMELMIFQERESRIEIELVRDQQQYNAIIFIKQEFKFLTCYNEHKKMLSAVQNYRKLNYTTNYGEVITDYLTKKMSTHYNQHILDFFIPGDTQAQMHNTHSMLKCFLYLDQQFMALCFNQKFIIHQLEKTPYIVDMRYNKKLDLSAFSPSKTLSSLHQCLKQRYLTQGIPTTHLSMELLKRLHLMIEEAAPKTTKQLILLLSPDDPTASLNALTRHLKPRKSYCFEELAFRTGPNNSGLQAMIQKRLLKNTLYIADREPLQQLLNQHDIQTLTDLIDISEKKLKSILDRDNCHTSKDLCLLLKNTASVYFQDIKKRRSKQFKQCHSTHIYDLIKYGIYFESDIHQYNNPFYQNTSIRSRKQLTTLSQMPSYPALNNLMFATQIMFDNLNQQLSILINRINETITVENTLGNEIEFWSKRLITTWTHPQSNSQTLDTAISHLIDVIDNSNNRLPFFSRLKKDIHHRIQKIRQPQRVHQEKFLSQNHKRQTPRNSQAEHIHTFNNPYI